MGSHDLKGPATADWLSPTLVQLHQLIGGPGVHRRRRRGRRGPIVHRRFEDAQLVRFGAIPRRGGDDLRLTIAVDVDQRDRRGGAAKPTAARKSDSAKPARGTVGKGNERPHPLRCGEKRQGPQRAANGPGLARSESQIGSERAAPGLERPPDLSLSLGGKWRFVQGPQRPKGTACSVKRKDLSLAPGRGKVGDSLRLDGDRPERLAARRG